MCNPLVVVWMQLIVMKYFEDPRLGYSQFSCDIAWASPRFSFHSYNYGIFIGWCPYSPWATCIHKCRRCYIFDLFLTRNHSVEVLCANFVSLCIFALPSCMSFRWHFLTKNLYAYLVSSIRADQNDCWPFRCFPGRLATLNFENIEKGFSPK
jgi:hypothetical protein